MIFRNANLKKRSHFLPNHVKNLKNLNLAASLGMNPGVGHITWKEVWPLKKVFKCAYSLTWSFVFKVFLQKETARY